jgi:hypothetical protein
MGLSLKSSELAKLVTQIARLAPETELTAFLARIPSPLKSISVSQNALMVSLRMSLAPVNPATLPAKPALELPETAPHAKRKIRS